MSHARRWLASFALLLVAASVAHGQDGGALAESQVLRAADAQAPAAKANPTEMPLLPMTMALDENGFPPPGPPMSLFSPFEVYVRGGPAFPIGDGVLDRAVRIGKNVTGGARSFLFNADCTAAWTSDLGLEYIYNDIQTADVILVRESVTPVTRFGQTVNLPTLTEYSLRELHRTSARLAFGREWYFGGPEWDNVRLNFGVDVGGKWGHVSAKLFVLNREIEGLQQFDTLPNFDDGHTSSVLKGVFFGVNTGLLLPMDGYDISVGLRFEWGQDWFNRIANDDRGIEQIQTLFFIGARY